VLAESDRRLAKKLLDRLQTASVPVRRLIVYGSRALGQAREDSDLDVLVLADDAGYETRNRVGDLAWEVGFEAGMLIQPVVMTPDQFERGPERLSLFALAVRRDGIAV
jgi:predicted nucleotidyltransferase